MTKHPTKPPDTPSEPQEPRSYVVRVYRSSLNCMVGQVEDVQTGLFRTFQSAQELWRAIGGGWVGGKASDHDLKK